MSVEFFTAPMPAPETRIAEFERELGGPLSPPYRRFLMARGGGKPLPNASVSEEATSVGVGVTWFFPVDELVKWRADFLDRVPAGLLAIADAEGGNLICLVVSGTDVGAVLFWDHELEAEEGEPPTQRNLTKVADNFDEFLESLKPISTSSGAQQPVKVISAWINPEFLAGLNQEPEFLASQERDQPPN